MDLLVKLKIYPVQHMAILELVYREYKPLVYKVDIYIKVKKKTNRKFKR